MPHIPALVDNPLHATLYTASTGSIAHLNKPYIPLVVDKPISLYPCNTIHLELIFLFIIIPHILPVVDSTLQYTSLAPVVDIPTPHQSGRGLWEVRPPLCFWLGSWPDENLRNAELKILSGWKWENMINTPTVENEKTWSIHLTFAYLARLPFCSERTVHAKSNHYLQT